jgi:hypothetical protein
LDFDAGRDRAKLMPYQIGYGVGRAKKNVLDLTLSIILYEIPDEFSAGYSFNVKPSQTRDQNSRPTIYRIDGRPIQELHERIVFVGQHYAVRAGHAHISAQPIFGSSE